MTKKRVQLGVAVAAVVLVGILLAWLHFSVRVTTDDAQIEGHVNQVSARVGGTVTAVLVKDNQFVEAGTPLVRIDARDYEIALERAQADLAENEASARAAHTGVPMANTVSSQQQNAAGSDVASAEARLASSRARLREAEARATKASQDVARLKPLLQKDEVAQQDYDAAVAEAEAVGAARESAAAAVNESEKQVEISKARLAQAGAGTDQVAIQKAQADSATAKAASSRADLDQAKLDLEHTEIRAAVSGVVSRRTVEVGQIVQAGQPLMAVVPLEEVWVVANYKENQLNKIRPGQKATIAVDAFGGREYEGKVDSIAAATGARFSILPPENASGNYVKVVQRVPVKIVLDAGQDPDHRLRPGMSVVPTILTR